MGDRIYKSVVDTMKRQGWFAEELFHYLGKKVPGLKQINRRLQCSIFFIHLQYIM